MFTHPLDDIDFECLKRLGYSGNIKGYVFSKQRIYNI
jgi:hypothetical protein